MTHRKSINNKLETYRTIDTLGKSQLDLVIKVYDGAIAAYRAAGDCYQNNDNEAGFEQSEKARKFITYLYTILDNEKGGQIAENLGRLYAFIINQSYVIEATKDSKLIDDIISILQELRSGWAGIQTDRKRAPGLTGNDDADIRTAKFSTTA